MWEKSTRQPSKDWPALRRQAIARAGGQCQAMQQFDRNVEVETRCPYPGDAVDHIINVARGGKDHIDNLQLLCTWHHNKKTQQEAAANRKKRSERHPGEKHPGIR